MNLLETIAEYGSNSQRESKITGVVIGIVTNNEDPDGLGRIKVRYPWLSDSDESYWARIATPMAGPERGLFILPEVDDEVLLAFENGDINRPYMLGALWNGQDKPPITNEDGNNHLRQFTTRAGHVVVFDDNTEDSAAKITVTTALGHELVMDDKDDTGKIALTTTAGHTICLDDENEKLEIIELNENSITMDSEGTVVTDANDNKIEMTSSGMVSEDANGNKIEMSSSGMVLTDANGNEIKMEAGGITITSATGQKIEMGAASTKVNNTSLEVM